MKKIIILFFLFSSYLIFNDYVGKNIFIKTVIKDDKIESISGKIIGEIRDGSREIKYLVELEDEFYSKYLGIPEGFSGSPVYLDNKIIAVLSYIFENNSKIAIATPAIKISNNIVESSLYPSGMSVSASPVRGDIQFENIGTLSFLDSDNKTFYAYGHGIGSNGAHLFLNKAKVQFILNGDIPQKIAYSTDEIGLITSENTYTMRGILGRVRDVYKFRVEYGDGESLEFEMPKYRDTIRFYLGDVYSEVLKKINYESGIRYINYRLELKKKGKNQHVENNTQSIYSDIFIEFPGELAQKIENLIYNEGNVLDVDTINLKLNSAHNEEKSMYIEDLILSKDVYQKNDKINYVIVLRDFKNEGKLIYKYGSINIPKDFYFGTYSVFLTNQTLPFLSKKTYENLNKSSETLPSDELNIVIKNDSSNDILINKINFDGQIQLNKKVKTDFIVDSIAK